MIEQSGAIMRSCYGLWKCFQARRKVFQIQMKEIQIQMKEIQTQMKENQSQMNENQRKREGNPSVFLPRIQTFQGVMATPGPPGEKSATRFMYNRSIMQYAAGGAVGSRRVSSIASIISHYTAPSDFRQDILRKIRIASLACGVWGFQPPSIALFDHVQSARLGDQALRPALVQVLRRGAGPRSLFGQSCLAEAVENGLELRQIRWVVAHRCPASAGAGNGEGRVEG